MQCRSIAVSDSHQCEGVKSKAVLLAAFKRKGVSAGNAVNAYPKGGKSGLSSGSILALASGTLKHCTLPLARPIHG